MPTVAKELNADGQGYIGRIRGLDCLKYGLNGILRYNLIREGEKKLTSDQR